MMRLLRLLLLSLFIFVYPACSWAQTAPGLYDPEPPANSGYLRLLHTSSDGALDLLVDGKIRITQLARGTPSDYLVLPSGKHTLELRQAGKIRLSLPFELASSNVTTLVFSTLTANSKPLLFDDKIIANKLKATLAVYHLQPSIESVDIITADGKLTVFPALAAGGTAVRAVNPIAIELAVTKSGSPLQIAQAKLNLSQGGSYSLFLLPDSSGKIIATALQNKIERYTGK
jgi:hypothetical protein